MMTLEEKQAELDRLIAICRKNNWPVPRTSGKLVTSHETLDNWIGGLRFNIAERSNGKRMRADGVYF